MASNMNSHNSMRCSSLGATTEINHTKTSNEKIIDLQIQPNGQRQSKEDSTEHRHTRGLQEQVPVQTDEDSTENQQREINEMNIDLQKQPTDQKQTEEDLAEHHQTRRLEEQVNNLQLKFIKMQKSHELHMSNMKEAIRTARARLASVINNGIKEQQSLDRLIRAQAEEIKRMEAVKEQMTTEDQENVSTQQRNIEYKRKRGYGNGTRRSKRRRKKPWFSGWSPLAHASSAHIWPQRSNYQSHRTDGNYQNGEPPETGSHTLVQTPSTSSVAPAPASTADPNAIVQPLVTSSVAPAPTPAAVADNHFSQHNLNTYHSFTISLDPNSSASGVIHITKGSVVDFSGDCIVNAANTGMVGGGGVDGAISIAGGDALLKLRQQIPFLRGSNSERCEVGDALLTRSGKEQNKLQCDFVIHAVGPNYETSNLAVEESDSLLYNAYTRCMKLAESRKMQTIAFSLISASKFRGDRSLDEVLNIGLRALRDNLYDGVNCFIVAYTQQELETLEKCSLEILTSPGVIHRRITGAGSATTTSATCTSPATRTEAVVTTDRTLATVVHQGVDFHVHDVRPDGNCLFRCFQVARGHHENTYMQARKEIHEFLMENRMEAGVRWQYDMEESSLRKKIDPEDLTDEQCKNYIEEFNHDGEYGRQIHIYAAAQRFGVRIDLLTVRIERIRNAATDESLTVWGGAEPSEPFHDPAGQYDIILLLYDQTSEHYSLLHRGLLQPIKCQPPKTR